MELCCQHVKDWMITNFLKLNDNKTEVILFGTRNQLQKCCSISSVEIGNSIINIQPRVKNIGVHLDAELKMVKEKNCISSNAWLHLCNIIKIRKHLTTEATVTLIHAFVTSKLDLNNAILYGCPKQSLDKLQRVLNAAAKVILGAPKYDSATPYLKRLNWLPIAERIEYKIILLNFQMSKWTFISIFIRFSERICSTKVITFI